MLPARRARLGPDAGGRVKMLAGFARAGGPAFTLALRAGPPVNAYLGWKLRR